MRKTLTLYATPIVTSVIVLLSVDGIDNIIKDNVGENTSLYLALSLVVFTVLNHVFTVVSPYKQYERIANNKWEILDAVVSNFARKYRPYALQFSIMKARPRWYHRTEASQRDPLKRRWRIYGKVLERIWTSDQNTLAPLKATPHQGIWGKSYRSAIGIVAIDCTKLNPADRDLSAEQLEMMKRCVFVASCPIYEIEKQAEHNLGRVIGVLNVQSSVKGAEKLADLDNPAKVVFDEDMASLAEFISKLAI